MFTNAEKYNEYVKAYNELGEKFDEINLSDDLWNMFIDVCRKALHLDLEVACAEMELQRLLSRKRA
ncbi:MAG: hypothetical protein ACLTZL_09915 [Romboutsia timonensis]|jgi:hypothetical protein|uniref:hypothetical protein n=1 Tax=Romboutsia timonensis TaxID=1776391 RepID=UPI0039923A3A